MKTKQTETVKIKKGSGKQILTLILSELSTKITPDEELSKATDYLRAGLLLHGSTAYETYEKVSKLTWSSSLYEKYETEDEEEDKVARQGIALANGNIFLSDLFESMIETPMLKEELLKIYPNLEPDDYEAGVFAIWLVLSSVQMFTELLSVEIDSSRIDVDAWVESMMRHYHHHLEHRVE
jgi:hypothetical protein